MPAWLQPLVVVGLPALAGAAWMRVLGLRFRDDRLAWPGWALLVGALWTALVVFLWSCTGAPLDGLGLSVGLVLVAVVGGLLGARRSSPPHEAEPVVAPPRAARWEWAVLAVVGAVVASYLVGWFGTAFTLPVTNGDEAHVWNLRGKFVYEAGGFNDAYRAEMSADPRFPYNKDYPLLNPLLQVWAFAVAGDLVHVLPRLPVHALHLALWLVLTSALVRRVRPVVAALFLLLLLGLPQTAEIMPECKADGMMGLGLLAALDAWSRWRERGELRWWRLFVLASALVVGTKHEGLIYFTAALGAIALTSPSAALASLRDRARLAWALLPVGVLALGWGFNAVFDFSNTVARGGWSEGPSFLGVLREHGAERVGYTFDFYRDRIVVSGKQTNYLFLAAFLLAAAHFRRLSAERLLAPVLAVALSLAGLFVIYLGTPWKFYWHLDTSAIRTAWQLLPATVLWIALVVATERPHGAPATGGPAGGPK